MNALNLDLPCTNLEGFRHEANRTIRFHPAKESQQCDRSKARITPASPFKVGNRTRNGLKPVAGFSLPLCRPDGQDGHTVAETWPESLRRHMASGVLNRPESDYPIHRPDRKENDCSLNGGGTQWTHCAGVVQNKPAVKGQPKGELGRTRHHSGNNGFLFSFHVRSDNSHMKRLGLLHISLGGVLLFLLFWFCFTLGLTAIQTTLNLN